MSAYDVETLAEALAGLTHAVDTAQRVYAAPSFSQEPEPCQVTASAFLAAANRLTGTRESGKKEETRLPATVHEERAEDRDVLPQHTLFPTSTDDSGNDLSRYTLEELQAQVAGCQLCGLCETRTYTVFGEGQDKNPVVMVIGEGPGHDEDVSGRPFVGKAGQYMDKWLAPIGLSRMTNVYIANIVKCRPPGNRDPQPEEVTACIPYLKRQLELVRPQFILLVGAVATRALLDTKQGVGSLRGRTFQYMDIPLMVTYHPAGVLRDPAKRGPVWEDMKRLASLAGLPILQGRKRGD